MTSTEERYLSASQSSNLKVEAERTGDVDVMVASGWSHSHIGHALMRIQSRPTRGLLELIHAQVAIEADRLNADNPGEVASAVIAYWLNRICKTCHGRMFETIKNTPSLSAIVCPACHGSGLGTIPGGEVGSYLVGWLDYCKQDHVGVIKRRLRPE